MRVLIIRSKKPEAIELAAKVSSWLESHNHEVIELDTWQSDGFDQASTVGLEITIGGDGTVLCGARQLKGLQIPVLAINMGTFGYISQTCADSAIDALQRFFNGELETDSRMSLKCFLYREDQMIWSSRALNEVAVSYSTLCKMIRLNLSIDGIDAASIRSDGLIVATPTGSTAYSMASGGPILDTSMDAMIINPVCPFTLSNRPIVIKGSSVVTLAVAQKQSTSILLCCDGQNPVEVLAGDRIVIQRGEGVVFLQTVKRSYLEVLRQKLKWSGDVNA